MAVGCFGGGRFTKKELLNAIDNDMRVGKAIGI